MPRFAYRTFLVLIHTLLSVLFLCVRPTLEALPRQRDSWPPVRTTFYVKPGAPLFQDQRNQCGEPDNPCGDFLQLIRRYCHDRKTRSGAPLQPTGNPLTLYLSPGVHNVSIPSNVLERAAKSRKWNDGIHLLSACDFSDCDGSIRMFGSTGEETTIFLAPNVTGAPGTSHCGRVQGITDIVRFSPSSTMKASWIFLAFQKGLTVHIANLTFQTSPAFSKYRQFFLYLGSVPRFRMEQCRFPDLSPRAGALLVPMESLKTCEKKCKAPWISIADSQFTHWSTCKKKDQDLDSLSAITIAALNQPQTSITGEEKPCDVEITRCEFILRCKYNTCMPMNPSAQRKNDTRSPQRHHSSKEAFALNAFIVDSRLDIEISECSFKGASPNSKACLNSSSAAYFQLSNGSITIVSSNFTNLVSERGSAIQMFGQGVAKKSQPYHDKQGMLVLKSVHFEDNGLQQVTKFGGALSFTLRRTRQKKKVTINRISLHDVTFINCSAIFGSALYSSTSGKADSFWWSNLLTDVKAAPVARPSTGLNTIFMNKTTVRGCSSALRGTVFADMISLTIYSGTFCGNKGSVVFLRNSFLKLGGRVEFTDNQASDGAAIAITARSRVMIESTEVSSNVSPKKKLNNIAFHNNQASIRGGAIFCDRESSILSRWDVLSKNIPSVSTKRYCPIYIATPTNITDLPTSFHQNSAALQGDDVYLFSLSLCSKKHFAFSSVASKYSQAHSYAITETSANYLILNGANTACVKRVGKYFWLLENCQRSTLGQLYKLEGKPVLSNLFAKSQGSAYSSQNSPLLPQEHFFNPWDSFLFALKPSRWLKHTKSSVSIYVQNNSLMGSKQTHLGIPMIPGFSELEQILTPSPGEVFSLNVACLDELGNRFQTAISLQVIAYKGDFSTPAKGLRLCFQEQCQRDVITFPANRELVGLSIEGLVGSQGWIRVSLNSESRGILILDVPFQLSSCLMGFLKTIQQNQSKIKVNPGMWVGIIAKQSRKKRQWKLCRKHVLKIGKVTLNQTASINDAIGTCFKNEDELWESAKTQEEMLVYGQCLNLYCDENEAQHRAVIDISRHRFTATDQHSLISLTGCAPHRRGLLCGKCDKGYSTTMYYKVCVSCNKTGYAGVLTSTCLVGFLLFLILLSWNWTREMVTSFSSLYFFGQAITFTTCYRPELPHLHEFVSRSLNLDWSFGMCLTEDLNALQRLAWSYLAPAYLLTLVLLSLFLSRFYRLNRIFGRSTCIKMFWQFILLSFSSLASTSFQIFRCTHLYPREALSSSGMPTLRFADDASFECFAGEHLPWAIVATVVVVIFCIPLPLTLPFLHHYHLLKPFYDVYTSVYKDNRRWWCSVDLLRRLLLAAIYSSVDDPEKGHLALALICGSLLFLHCLLLPFKSSKANVIEGIFLFSLLTITLLSAPEVTFPRVVGIESIFFVSIAVFVIDLMWEQQLIWWQGKNRLRTPGFGVAWHEGEDDGTMLRDRLLADSPPTGQ